MSIMKLTMIGLETILHQYGESIFDLLTLPDGIDKDTLTDNIIMRGGEFEVLYSDPHFFRQCVGTWSKKCYHTFDKWAKALAIEYSPLENYDRFEDWQDAGSEVANTKNDGTNHEVNDSNVDVNGQESSTDTSRETGKTTLDSSQENTVSAYDSDSYQPADKTDNDSTENRENDSNRQTNSTSTNKTSSSNVFDSVISNNEDLTKNTEGTHKGRIHGNVGVTTSQQMLQSELDIARFNIIDQITDSFLMEFCLMIYT